MRRLACAILAALAGGCRITVDLAEYDRMQRELGVRSVLRGEGFTLWSPQNWVSARDWFLLVGEELPAVRRALGLAPAETPYVQVLLREVEGLQAIELAAEGDSLSFTAAHRPHPLHGVAGWAVEGEITIPIAPARVLRREDGREVTSVMSAETYRRVVRHELAHALLYGRGLPEADWFSEGAAELIEGLELEGGELVDAGAPREALELAVQAGLLERPLADLLDWSEDGAAVAAGRERVDAAGRVLCGLYVRWSVGLSGERAPALDLLAALARLAQRTRAEHLEGEARWHAWLAAQAACGTADAGIPRAPDYTLAPANLSPAPPVPATDAPR